MSDDDNDDNDNEFNFSFEEVNITDYSIYNTLVKWSNSCQENNITFSMIHNQEDEDKEIPFDRFSDEYHPVSKTHPYPKEKHEIYLCAMNLVGAKNSKYGLVDIINALLVENLMLEDEVKKSNNKYTNLVDALERLENRLIITDPLNNTLDQIKTDTETSK